MSEQPWHTTFFISTRKKYFLIDNLSNTQILPEIICQLHKKQWTFKCAHCFQVTSTLGLDNEHVMQVIHCLKGVEGVKLQLFSLVRNQRFTQNTFFCSIRQYYSDITNKQKTVSRITTNNSSLVNMVVHLWGEPMGDQWFPVQKTINVEDFAMSWHLHAYRVKSLKGRKKQPYYNIICKPT